MPDWVVAGFMAYAQRMPREIPLHLIEIKPEKRGAKQTKQLLLAEGERIQAALPPACYKVVMDEQGKQITTIQLAETLVDWMRIGRDVAFIVGGADGLHQEIKSMANEFMALSRLTLPHGLARVLLVEQLYRAFSIIRQHPYHRA